MPQAFLTVIFFDERFNFIAAADGGVAQQEVAASVGSNGSSLTLANIKAPKNGYAFLYISNQGNKDVYWDNLQVGIVQGNIAEENHYYAYGLKIATLSSKKLGDVYEGTLKNNYLYNDKELFDDADLNWYDYGFRNYDPQIGRFTQLDPLTDYYPFLTPYQYASCDPIDNIDIDGLEGGLSTTADKAIELVGIVARNGPSTVTSIGSSIGKSLSTSAKIGIAIKGANLINTTFTSESTCQGCAVNKKLYAPSSPKKPETIISVLPTEAEKTKMGEPENWREEMDEWENSYEASFINKIHQENIESVENGPYKGIPVFQDVMKAGRYEFKYSYHKEARAAFGNAVKEAAIWYVGGKAFNGAIKFFFRRLPKLLSQFATPTIDDAVELIMKDANKLGHIFDAKHNLGPLVTKLGGEENTIRAVLNAANGRLPANGVFNAIPVTVEGQTVYISGNVINGTPRIGTMYVK